MLWIIGGIVLFLNGITCVAVLIAAHKADSRVGNDHANR